MPPTFSQVLVLLSGLLGEPGVVTIKRQQSLVLRREAVGGATQFDLQGLHRLLVLTGIDLTLLLGGLPEVIQGIACLRVFGFDRGQVFLVLGQLSFKASHTLMQTDDRGIAFAQDLFGRCEGSVGVGQGEPQTLDMVARLMGLLGQCGDLAVSGGDLRIQVLDWTRARRLEAASFSTTGFGLV